MTNYLRLQLIPPVVEPDCRLDCHKSVRNARWLSTVSYGIERFGRSKLLRFMNILTWSAGRTGETRMDFADRLFTLRLKDESFTGPVAKGAHIATLGELWHGDGRVPVAGLTSYRGRVDAVITFFVDQFLTDELFQAGDSLAIAAEQGEPVVLVRRLADETRSEVNER